MKRFVLVFASVAGLLFLAMLVLNLWVDPLAAHPSSSLDALAPYRQLASRSAKVTRLEAGDWDALVLGDSRVHSGIDPSASFWGASRVYNAGIPATTMIEVATFFDVGIAHSDLERVIVVVGIESFVETGGAASHTYQLPTSALEDRLQLALGWRGVVPGRNLFDAVRAGRRGTTAADGMLRPREPEAPRESFAASLAQTARLADDYAFDPEAWAALERVVDRALDEGAEVRVAVPPVHATVLAAYHDLGAFDEHLEVLRRLAELAHRERASGDLEVWDFSGFVGAVAEPVPLEASDPPLEGYYDAMHFRPGLGGAMISAMLSASEGRRAQAPLGGTLLTAETIDAHLLRTQEEARRYFLRRPEDAAFMRAAIGSRGQSVDESARGPAGR